MREADDGARTRDTWLGKPVLYQLSYVRRLRAMVPGQSSEDSAAISRATRVLDFTYSSSVEPLAAAPSPPPRATFPTRWASAAVGSRVTKKSTVPFGAKHTNVPPVIVTRLHALTSHNFGGSGTRAT